MSFALAHSATLSLTTLTGYKTTLYGDVVESDFPMRPRSTKRWGDVGDRLVVAGRGGTMTVRCRIDKTITVAPDLPANTEIAVVISLITGATWTTTMKLVRTRQLTRWRTGEPQTVDFVLALSMPASGGSTAGSSTDPVVTA